MSLIPYNPREGSQIVLRHRNAIVVRDASSARLEIRGVSECPTCHQPLNRATSPDRSFDGSLERERDDYVNPDYFRMLRAGNHAYGPPQDVPSSPIRRFVQPALNQLPAASHRTVSSGTAEAVPEDGHGFGHASPGVAQPDNSRIRRDAFSPNYFKTFFVEESELGRGGKGVVLLVRHEIDGCALGQFACKRVPVGDDHAWLEKVLIEVELLAKLSHPNLVSYRHVWLEDVQLTRFGPSVACAYILQQYCNGGDLHRYVLGDHPQEVTKEQLKERMRRRSRGQSDTPPSFLGIGVANYLAFEEIYSVFKDITSGVAYLHEANYIHRDLKPSNCLLHREAGKTTCLISDFGEVQAEHIIRTSSGSTGTISYCAPEVLKVDPVTQLYGNFTTKSDMFSLGMILYFMCFGRLPYRSANAMREELEDADLLRAEIMDWQGFQDEQRERPDLPPKLYQLLTRLLSINPTERPSASEVLAAMKSDSSLDGMSRSDRTITPPMALHSGRVHNLDTPAPGSPSGGDPRKYPARGRTLTQDELSPWGRVEVRDETPVADPDSTVRRRSSIVADSQAMALSRSRGGFSQSPANGTRADVTGVDGQGRKPPLLLEAPRSMITSIPFQDRLGAALLRFSRTSGLSFAVMSYSVRLAIFMLKAWTLTRSCWPYMAAVEVSVPLLLLATLDFGLPPLRANGTSRLPSQELGSPILRAWGPGTSLLLLLFHFGVLWLARRQTILCSWNPPDTWADWEH